MKRYSWTLALFLPLALAGCETVGSLFDDEDARAGTVAEEPSIKYVTVTVKDRYGFRVKDPLGQRTTGGSCGIWKDAKTEMRGGCCWNNRGDCACPCPE